MFKRNQIEEAIAVALEPGSANPSLVRIRLKRLLETDRALGRSRRSVDPERANFAFYSKDMPGRGVENWFSNYEAFALLTGLQLMRHGWPQGFAVGVLRRLRPELEKHHAGILRQEPSALFDDRLIRQRAKPGLVAVDSTDPVFLAITSPDQEGRSAVIRQGQRELMRLITSQELGQTWTIFELTNTIHALSRALARTKPRRRGRN